MRLCVIEVPRPSNDMFDTVFAGVLRDIAAELHRVSCVCCGMRLPTRPYPETFRERSRQAIGN
jgi:hypothetical protein